MSQRSSRFTGVRSIFAAVICGLVFTVASFHAKAAEFSLIEFFGNFFGVQRATVVDSAPIVSTGPIIFQRGLAAASDIPYNRGGQLFKVDPVSGVETSFGAGSQPNYSLDGSKLVFLNNAHITTSPANSYTPTELTIAGGGSPIIGLYPKWSSDNARIAYNSTQSINSTLVYHIKIIAGNCTACDISQELNRTGSAAYLYPAWYPGFTVSGTSKIYQLVFVRTSAVKADVDAGNYTGDVFTESITVAADGTVTEGTRKNLTNNPATYAFPVYSFDGSKLIFVKRNPDNSSALMQMDWIAPENQTVPPPPVAIFSYPSGNQIIHHPAWSPDAFASSRIVFGDTYQLFKIGPLGGTATPVTTLANSDVDLWPSWAPGSGNPTPTPTPTPTRTTADVEIAFSSAPPTSVSFGDTITLSLRVTNNGPEIAHGVAFIGFVDSRFDNIATPVGLGCSISGHTVTCNIGDMDSGSSSSIRITAQAVQTGGTSNSMLVGVDGARTFDPNSANNSVSANITIGNPSVELLGLEVTQAVQDLRNSVPLVADKRTFIRAYVRTTAAASGAVMSASLVGTNSAGVTNGRLSSSNPGQTVRVLQNPQRGTLTDSFYFELPSDWIKAGTLQFRIESADATLVCEEPDGTPNCATTVTFQRMRKLSINFIGVTWTDASGGVHAPNPSDLLQTAAEIQARFPLVEIDAELSATTFTDNPCTVPFTTMLDTIENLRTQDISNGKATKKYYMGLMPDQSSCGGGFGNNGIAFIPGNSSLIFLMRNGNNIFPGTTPFMDGNSRAHELEHNTGINHTPSGGGEANPATDYLPADGRISTGRTEYGANTAYGFDINNSSSNRDGARIFLPTTYDSMTYKRARWMSVTNYNKLFISIGVAPPGTAPEEIDPAAVMVTQSVTISGNISPPPEVGTLAPIFVKNTNAVITLPDPGSYEIRFENAAGQMLATYGFDPLVDADGNHGKFSLVLPWNTDARRIKLLHNGQELVSRQATTNTPTVTVTSPNGSETLNGPTATFTWTAADADGDALTYVIDYSSDAGTTWNTLASGLTSTSYRADVTKLRASTQALLRVSASDGFKSAQDQSNAVFTVSGHAPEVSISTPANNDLYVGDQTIVLNAMGLDIEDGILAGSRLSWSSNLNGTLGTGNSLAISASTLMEGTHTITVTATDSTAGTGTATVSIRVFRNRPVLPAALSVGPTNLAFAASMGTIQTALQTVAIRNSGDGVITWSATADQPWFHLDSTSGTAPSNLSVTADPTGLAIGQYTGSLTITSPGVANSPQTIQVAFSVTQPVPVTVSGRVLTSDGRGLRNATASITDSNGVVRTTTTSSFGFYSFSNVLTGGTYTVRIASRFYRFAPRVVPVADNLTDVDFMGLE